MDNETKELIWKLIEQKKMWLVYYDEESCTWDQCYTSHLYDLNDPNMDSRNINKIDMNYIKDNFQI